MGELVAKLIEANPVINWFALGEAKRLVHESRLALVAYQGSSKRDKTINQTLKDVAQKAATFLYARSTPDAFKHASAIRRALKDLNNKEKP